MVDRPAVATLKLALATPRSWLGLLALLPAYLLVLAFLATVIGKSICFRLLSPELHTPLNLLRLVLPDVTVFFSLTALLIAGALRSRALYIAASLVAFPACVFGLFNAAFVSITGDQLSPMTLSIGWSRIADAWAIFDGQVGVLGAPLAFSLVALTLAIPLLLSRWLARRSPHIAGAANGAAVPRWAPAAAALCVASAGGLLWMSVPPSDAQVIGELSRNALLDSGLSWLRGSGAGADGDSGKPGPTRVVFGPFASGPPKRRSNVVVLVIESLRYDHTELPDKPGRSHTPHIRDLAAGGTWTRQGRAHIPHTTKSLFAMFCGRHPIIDFGWVETHPNIQVQCLPEVLRDAGYQTAHFQSAIGAFEDRPRLVARMGFTEFSAWENLQGQPLGYLSSDDLSLQKPFAEWLDARDKGRPFMAAVLTSATHHPYALPTAERRAMADEGLRVANLSAEERYSRLVTRADRLVGGVVEDLRVRGLLDDTVLVVAGDHGEGFGVKVVRQHDNNFFEEGLHVPIAIAGPGVPERVVDHNVSLSDVAVTLAELLEVPLAIDTADARSGQSILHPRDPEAPHLFACYFNDRCVGAVAGKTKLVYLQNIDGRMLYDLEEDPDEEAPRPLEASDEVHSALLRTVMRVRTGLVVSSSLREPPAVDLTFDNGWRCESGKPCRHPRTPPKMFFGQGDGH